MSRALTRHVGRDASPNTIVFTTLLVGVIPISVAAAMTWQMPVATECLWYVAIAAGGFSAQFCLAASYRVGQVGEIASLEFIVIPMSAAVGFLAFGQIPSFRTWAGIAVIAVAAGYAIHRDRLASLPHRSPDLALRKDVRRMGARQRLISAYGISRMNWL